MRDVTAQSSTFVGKALEVSSEPPPRPSPRGGVREVGAGVSRWAMGVVLPVALLVAWELATRYRLVKPVFLPKPWDVYRCFREMLAEEGLATDFQVSVVVVLKGFVAGSLVGVLAGIAAGLSKSVERFLGPTLNSIRQVPPMAWLPLVVLWIGIGGFAKGFVVAKAVFFPVFLNTLQGIRGVSKEYVEVARVFEYRRPVLLRRVILPSALPSIAVGVRYGAGLAWASVIAAEMLSGRVGLGYLLMRSQELLLTEQMFVVILIIGGVGLIVDVLLRRVEGRLLVWRRGFDG